MHHGSIFSASLCKCYYLCVVGCCLQLIETTLCRGNEGLGFYVAQCQTASNNDHRMPATGKVMQVSQHAAAAAAAVTGS